MKQLLANTAKIFAVVVATPRNGCPTPATASPCIPTSAPTLMRSIISGLTKGDAHDCRFQY